MAIINPAAERSQAGVNKEFNSDITCFQMTNSYVCADIHR